MVEQDYPELDLLEHDVTKILDVLGGGFWESKGVAFA